MKKIISVLLLIIMFISATQNVIFGATSIEYADLIKGNTIEAGVQFYEDGIWYMVECNYVYYQGKDGEHPAYCVSHRKRWCRRSWKLSSRY